MLRRSVGENMECPISVTLADLFILKVPVPLVAPAVEVEASPYLPG